LIRTGSDEGDIYTITGNTADSVTLDLQGGSLAGLNAGDLVAIIPYWTLGTVFPGGQGVHPSVSAGNRSTEVLFPDLGGTGVNLTTARSYYFLNGAWRQVGQGNLNKNDDVVAPDMFVWVRHNVPTGTELVARGSVLSSGIRLGVRLNSGIKQDNLIALPRPGPVSLSQSGLIESGAFRPSISAGNRLDELFIFDNTTLGKNKSAAATYYYLNGGWRKVGSGNTDVGGDIVFQPGTGVILRSGAGASGVWTNNANY